MYSILVKQVLRIKNLELSWCYLVEHNHLVYIANILMAVVRWCYRDEHYHLVYIDNILVAVVRWCIMPSAHQTRRDLRRTNRDAPGVHKAVSKPARSVSRWAACSVHATYR